MLVPYTNSKGDIPMDFLLLTLSARKALTSLRCQFFLFASNIFLIIFTKDLFDDSANPLPYRQYAVE